MTREAWCVTDIGFGDAGKGTVTDFLVRDRGATLVVRHHGGAQAGHNVVTPDGRHHTFSQFSAGTLAGAEGLLGPDFLLHPLGMWMEAQHLVELGIRDPWSRTAVDRRARLITPYQQAANQARERLRGDNPHGTCGIGIGECVSDSIHHPEDTLRAGDLDDRARLKARLRRQRARKRAELAHLGVGELSVFDDDTLIERVLDVWSDVRRHLQLLDETQTAATIDAHAGVVFEGAQGILLDERWGFHPHTTWSDCTPAGAHRLAGDRPLHRLAVTRAYSVRHGHGPFPTAHTLAVPEAHNADDGWQGTFRTGALDGVLLRYAFEVSGGFDGIAVTCLDRVTQPPCCEHYEGRAPASLVDDGPDIHRLLPGAPDDLSHREQLGQLLQTVRPVLAPQDPVTFVERITSCPVWLTSHGPTHADKRWRPGSPARPLSIA